MLEKLMDSSIDTYVQYMAGVVKRNEAWREASAAASLAHADADALFVASTVSLSDLKSIIRHLPGIHKHAAWFLAISVGRFRDIQRLRRSQMGFDGNTCRVQWRVTKQRRKRWLRVVTVHKMNHFPRCAETATFFDSMPADSRPFATLRLGAFNQALEVARRKGQVQQKVTTYSIRRYAIFRLFVECKGNVDLVMKSTGHLRPGTIQAFYKEWKTAAGGATQL
jgi:integrase